MAMPAIDTSAARSSANKASYAQLARGDLLPRIYPRVGDQERFAIDACAGRYIVLCFIGSAGDPFGRRTAEVLLKYGERHDAKHITMFAISCDRKDETEKRIPERARIVRAGYDFDLAVSRACGAASHENSAPYRRMWMVIDPTLRVLAVIPFRLDDADHQKVFQFLDRLPVPERYASFEIPAPVLILPNIFDPELCQRLIRLYDQAGGMESGVVRDGREILDASAKRRKDVSIADPATIRQVQKLILTRACPEIERLFFMKITRMERYIVGCYAAEDGGHFIPHRDNTSVATEYRRYAISINLNADFEGGEVSFPEYSPRGYKAPPGWGVVFPCNILHRVAKVTSGKRYAFLPFVYDEDGKRIRDRIPGAAMQEEMVLRPEA
jgi:predicted 2-oxoglutarate/Fe(II)-dependent dioxygenase YbiX